MTNGLNYDDAKSPVFIPYMGLDGGLNTAKDPHALLPNELAASVNLWPSYIGAVTKRPGSIPIGNSGTGKPCKSLLACRFNDATYLIEVKTDGRVFAGLSVPGSTFTHIGNCSANAKFVTAAQMTDPYQKLGGTPGVPCVFLCDGVGIPQFWAGPGTMLQNVFFGTDPNLGSGLPSKDAQGLHPITPQYVATLGNNSHLFYSGDSDNPSAVYISDPFYPEFFNSPAMQVNPTRADSPGQYIPAIIGNNDGVDGGDITGLDSLGSVMVVFKECAVYNMQLTTLLGEVPAWQVVQVSNNRGNLSPRSLTAFDSFITFLAIDGVYATDASTIWSISGDVPTFFDSTLYGEPALIADRTTAIGVRHGTRLLLFFVGPSAPNTSGLWFEFAQSTAQGFPKAGQIEGMNVGGAVALTGAKDDGNFAWSDAAIDNVARFGIGWSDLGTNNAPVAITSTFAGRADLMDSAFGPSALVAKKQVQTGYLLVELQGAPGGQNAQGLDFQGAVLVDNQILYPRVIAQLVAQGNSTSGIWGSGVWGAMKWGGTATFGFAVIKIPMQNASRGYMLQFVLTESSSLPYVIIGYCLYANLHPVGY